MTRLYVILSVAGWAWALVFGAFLLVRLRGDKSPRGFDVVERHEK